MFQTLAKLCMVSTLCLLSATSWALASDSKQKVVIIADSSIYNYKSGINLYQGNVMVDQGTTHIRSSRLITKNNALHKIEEATAYGDDVLAHFTTLQKLGSPEINAQAKVIKFYPQNTNAILQDEVLITQGENSFRGQLIHYNGNDETIIVPVSSKGRAVIVYNPDQK